MNILVLGSGGREHTFAWKLAQSKTLGELFIAPGNAGTALCGTNIDIAVNDFEGIKKLVWEKAIDLVLVGPEEPLVRGIHDFFLNDEILKDVPIIGPKADGAQLEGSKDFSKQFMQKYGIPTAAYESFTTETLEKGLKFLETLKPPYVLKADGLAAGKGVVIPNTLEEAKKELKEMLNGKFGKAGSKVVIEEFLNGIELSVFVLSDGKNYMLLPSAKDYKRIGEGDAGPNTGGMGAVSPVPFADRDFIHKVEERIVKPTMQGLLNEGIEYKGFIFIGLMNCNGNPFVIEYNCRMGDPETEVVIPRIGNDFCDLLLAVANQKLNEKKLQIDARYCTTVMLVSGGYPGDYSKGKEINGLEQKHESLVFHAGTSLKEGKVITNGGRVLAVSSFGDSIQDAISKSYACIDKIHWEEMYFRKDIGKDLMV